MTEDIPSNIRKLIKDCWHPDRHFRPSFSEILDRLDDIVVDNVVKDLEGRALYKRLRRKEVWLSFSLSSAIFRSFLFSSFPIVDGPLPVGGGLGQLRAGLLPVLQPEPVDPGTRDHHLQVRQVGSRYAPLLSAGCPHEPSSSLQCTEERAIVSTTQTRTRTRTRTQRRKTRTRRRATATRSTSSRARVLRGSSRCSALCGPLSSPSSTRSASEGTFPRPSS
jgi:hypothetical protein